MLLQRYQLPATQKLYSVHLEDKTGAVGYSYASDCRERDSDEETGRSGRRFQPNAEGNELELAVSMG